MIIHFSIDIVENIMHFAMLLRCRKLRSQRIYHVPLDYDEIISISNGFHLILKNIFVYICHFVNDNKNARICDLLIAIVITIVICVCVAFWNEYKFTIFLSIKNSSIGFCRCFLFLLLVNVGYTEWMLCVLCTFPI